MQWANAGEFFAMGGYAVYVWGSFGLCAVLMLIEPILARKRLKDALRSISREKLADELTHEPTS